MRCPLFIEIASPAITPTNHRLGTTPLPVCMSARNRLNGLLLVVIIPPSCAQSCLKLWNIGVPVNGSVRIPPRRAQISQLKYNSASWCRSKRSARRIGWKTCGKSEMNSGKWSILPITWQLRIPNRSLGRTFRKEIMEFW